MAPAFLITIGVIFILYMVISQVSSNADMREWFGDSSKNIGSVNGKDISYEEFHQMMQKATENQRQQTGKDIEEEQIDQFRDQVWQSMVATKLLDEAVNDMGIIVTDKEVQELLTGPNPPDYLKRNFMDSAGNFNRQAYDQAIRDKRNDSVLVIIKDGLKQQLTQEKLFQVINAGAFVSEGEIRRAFIDQYCKLSAEYAVIGMHNFPDSTIKPSADDLKAYYDAHPDEFKTDNMRKIKYVYFPLAASKADSNFTLENLKSILERIKIGDTTKFENYATPTNGITYSKDTSNMTQLPADFVTALGNHQPGDLIGPMFGGAGCELYKYMGANEGAKTVVRASHILIPFETSDTAAALNKAMGLYDQLAGGANFAELAMKNSKDPGSAAKGGDLGWFDKGKMVPEFENACFNGAIDVVQKPVKTQFGYHIIKVTGKSSRSFVIEKLVQPIKISGVTRSTLYRTASDFSYVAEKNGFEPAAKEMNLAVQESAEFSQDADQIPGIGGNKGLIDYIFDSGLDKVAQQPFRVSSYYGQNGYIVFVVSSIIKQGVKKLDDVKAELTQKVIQEKKYEKSKAAVETLQKKIGVNLGAAPTTDGRAQFNTIVEFSPGGAIPGLGQDYNFAAQAYRASKNALNKVIGPIRGAQGYYLIRVTRSSGFDKKAFTEQHDGIRDRLMQEKKQRLVQNWMEYVKQKAKIVDHRYKFYD
jgi:parvulin-like peptidyl-prolyl isomerase